MTAKLGRGKITDGRSDPRPLKGVERRRQLMAEDAAEIARIVGHLLETLPRPPTVRDEMRASLIARTSVKITRLDEMRRNSLPERQLLEELLRVPFNVEVDILGPKAPGRKYFTVTKGDGFVCRTDPATAEAPVTDEVSHNV
jgi:hypothetical protein